MAPVYPEKKISSTTKELRHQPPNHNIMARRRVKKRTHVGASNGANPTAKGKPMEKTPKSMVIRIGAGEIGPSVSQLVKDLRLVMEPGTASRLKVCDQKILLDTKSCTKHS